MADQKISQLTAATTPLAGTEVLPIVQSGTTKQVSVANLTSGRSVLASTLGIGGAVNVSYTITSYGPIYSTTGANFFAGTVGIGTTPAYKLDVVSGGGSALMLRVGQTGVSNGFTISSTGSALSYQFDDGNLIQGTAGRGVNFTANTPAAGMTSQLLNWYEEGTFTPTLGGSTTYTTQIGRYTRVGRQVTVQIVMTINALNTPTSAAQIRGLPFTSANVTNLYQTGSVSYWSGANTPAFWVGCYVSPNSTVIDITSTTSGAQAAANTPFAIFKDGTNIMLSLTYFV